MSYYPLIDGECVGRLPSFFFTIHLSHLQHLGMHMMEWMLTNMASRQSQQHGAPGTRIVALQFPRLSPPLVDFIRRDDLNATVNKKQAVSVLPEHSQMMQLEEVQNVCSCLLSFVEAARKKHVFFPILSKKSKFF